jgi:hypothetical protein
VSEDSNGVRKICVLLLILTGMSERAGLAGVVLGLRGPDDQQLVAGVHGDAGADAGRRDVAGDGQVVRGDGVDAEDLAGPGVLDEVPLREVRAVDDGDGRRDVRDGAGRGVEARFAGVLDGAVLGSDGPALVGAAREQRQRVDVRLEQGDLVADVDGELI